MSLHESQLKKMIGANPDDESQDDVEVTPAQRRLIDSYKKRMHEIADDQSRPKKDRLKEVKALYAELLVKFREMKSEEREDGEPITVEITDKSIFEPMAKRRKALTEAAKAKGNDIEDGVTIDEQSGEVTFDFEKHEQYWSEFWSQYGLEYKPEGTVNEDQAIELLGKGMDFFLGMPEVTPDQLREICEKEGLQIWNPERLDLPAINRSGLPEENYPLALKIAKEIAKHESAGDEQLKQKEVTFTKAQEIAQKAGLKGLTYKEYTIIQLWYYKTTGNHLDESSWTWLLDQQAPSSGRAAYANYRGSGVCLDEYDMASSGASGGVRLSDILALET